MNKTGRLARTLLLYNTDKKNDSIEKIVKQNRQTALLSKWMIYSPHGKIVSDIFAIQSFLKMSFMPANI